MGLREIVDKAAQGFGLLVLVLIFAPMTLSLLLVPTSSTYVWDSDSGPCLSCLSQATRSDIFGTGLPRSLGTFNQRGR